MSNFIVDFIKKSLDKKNNSNQVEKTTPKLKKIEKVRQQSLNKLETNMSLASKNIKIDKESNIKLIKQIFLQLILGIIFIFISFSYLNNHPVEKKFFVSSVNYWSSILSNLYAKLGGSFTKQVDSKYTEKRKILLQKIKKTEEKLKTCIKKEKNTDTKKELITTLNNIQSLKIVLKDEQYLSMSKFEEKYNYYDMWTNSFVSSVDKYCN